MCFCAPNFIELLNIFLFRTAKWQSLLVIIVAFLKAFGSFNAISPKRAPLSKEMIFAYVHNFALSMKCSFLILINSEDSEEDEEFNDEVFLLLFLALFSSLLFFSVELLFSLFNDSLFSVIIDLLLISFRLWFNLSFNNLFVFLGLGFLISLEDFSFFIFK